MSFEATTKMARSAEKAKKPEKSQEELRTAFEQKLLALKPALQEGIEEYEKALKSGVFEDADGEPDGTGETRKKALRKKLGTLFNRAEKIKAMLDSKEALSQTTPEISVFYTHPDGKKETITLDLEAKLKDFIAFYQKTGIDVPPDFEDAVRDIWDQNQTEIEQAIEQDGFDEVLVIPGNIPLPDLAEKMKMEDGYWESDNFEKGGSFAGAISQNNVDKPRIILVHKTKNLNNRPELKKTLNTRGQDVKMDQALTLEDYLVFQRKYFEETGTHLDEDGWTWLATKSGARLVDSAWIPGDRELYVHAGALDGRDASLGVRPSRCFF